MPCPTKVVWRLSDLVQYPVGFLSGCEKPSPVNFAWLRASSSSTNGGWPDWMPVSVPRSRPVLIDLLVAFAEGMPEVLQSWRRDWGIAELRMTVEIRRQACGGVVAGSLDAIMECPFCNLESGWRGWSTVIRNRLLPSRSGSIECCPSCHPIRARQSLTEAQAPLQSCEGR